MDQIDRDAGLAVARDIARSGEHRDWRAVETKLQQMGHLNAELWFAPPLRARGEIDALCGLHFKKRRPDA